MVKKWQNYARWDRAIDRKVVQASFMARSALF